MNKFISSKYANESSPEIQEKWISMSQNEKFNLIESILNGEARYEKFKLVKIEKNGFLILKVEENISANERGLMLLELEEKIKREIDEGLTVWLEPVGDKSKLRNLRGISFKEL